MHETIKGKNLTQRNGWTIHRNDLFARTLTLTLTLRDKQAIESIKAAINKPKTPSFPLIECEFPPLAALNKLGDGSRSSSNQVDDVRIDIKLYVYKNTYVSWREVSGSSKMRPG